MIVPEPTRERLWISHPGIMYFRVKVTGQPAHAARSHEGVNAIGKMVPIIRALESLDEKRARTLSYPLLQKETGRACNLSIGTMKAGDWVSTVAGFAVLEGRVGFTPSENGREVRLEVEQAIRDAVSGDAWFAAHPVEVEWFGWNAEPWVESNDSDLIRSLRVVASSVLGAEPEISSSSGGLDTRFGTQFGVPSVAFGPRGGGYHGIDEYVELDSLKRVTRVLALFMGEWCELED
jgi:acetylornithine deacetylase